MIHLKNAVAIAMARGERKAPVTLEKMGRYAPPKMEEKPRYDELGIVDRRTGEVKWAGKWGRRHDDREEVKRILIVGMVIVGIVIVTASLL